jgi:hypothetical protein
VFVVAAAEALHAVGVPPQQVRSLVV